MISFRPLFLGLFLVLVGFVWHGIQPHSGAQTLDTGAQASPVHMSPGANVAAPWEPLAATRSTRIKVLSSDPRAGDRAFLRAVLPGSAATEREVEVGLWALVEPGAWVAALESPEGTRREQTVRVVMGDSKVVALMASEHAQIQGRLIERHGERSGVVDIWFLPEGAHHPQSQAEAGRLPHTRCTFEGSFFSPKLEPGPWRISLGPVGEPFSAPFPPSLLKAGSHGVEVHMERGLRVDFVLDRALEASWQAPRLELQRRVRRPAVTEGDDRAWRKVSTIPASRLVKGRGHWLTVPAGRYRLCLRAGKMRWASPGWDLIKTQDLSLQVSLPVLTPGATPLDRGAPSLPLGVLVLDPAGAASWEPTLVWLGGSPATRR